ncbi:MAG: choice-of-anchor tandem repeat NxxGxxAF-containing protein, partial [Acidobacteriota bacterium]
MRVSRQIGFLLLVGMGLIVALTVSSVSFEGVSSVKAQATGQDPKPKEEDPVPVGVRPREVPPASSPTINPGEFGTFFSPQLNNRGDVAFLGRYSTGTAAGSFGQGVFVRLTDGQWKFLRDDERATNIPDSGFSFGPFSLNDKAELTLTASFGTRPAIHEVQPGAPAAPASRERNTGVFTNGANGFTKLISLGEEVPNMPSRFSSFSNPSMNTKGTIVFVAAYVDPDGRGLFVSEQGKLRIVARSGQR